MFLLFFTQVSIQSDCSQQPFEMCHSTVQPRASLIWYSRVVKIGKARCSNTSTLATRGANVVKRLRARRREMEEMPQLSVKKSSRAQKQHGNKIMKSRTSHASAAAGKCLSLKGGFKSVTITLCISDWLNYNSQVLLAPCISSFFPPWQALNSSTQGRWKRSLPGVLLNTARSPSYL